MRHAFLPALALLIPATAFAHPGAHPVHEGSGLLLGLAHPLGGADHLLAMVAVGLWAGTIGGRALLALPASFVGVMALGGISGAAGMPFPDVEPMILASVIVLGAATALALRPRLAASLAIVAVIGFAHGYAHGAEGPAAGFLAYGAGFVLATVALHALGIALAAGLGHAGRRAPRLAGGAVSLAGLLLVFLP